MVRSVLLFFPLFKGEIFLIESVKKLRSGIRAGEQTNRERERNKDIGRERKKYRHRKREKNYRQINREKEI